MSWTTVYSKTAKGLLAATGKGKRVTKEQLLLLKLVDGTSSEVGLLAKTSSFTEAEMHQALESLANDGYLKAIGGVTQAQAPAEEDDLGSFATLQVAVANTQAFFDAQAEVEMLGEYKNLLKADREALIAKLDEPDQKAAPARKEPDQPVRRLSAQEAKAELEALAREETRLEEERRAKAKEDELARQIEENEAGVQRALELWGKEEADAKAKADAAAAKARGATAAQELARKQKEEEARAAAERKARAEAEARAQAEEQLRRAAEQKATALAEAQAKAKAEESVRKQKEEAARVEAERKAREAAEALAKAEAEQQARQAAEQRARELVEVQAKAEAEELAKAQEEETARAEADRIARAAAETLRKAQEEERIRREPKLPAKAVALAQLKAETEALARRQEEQKARMEAKRRAREEEEARAKGEAQARAEAEEAARIQRQQAERTQAERGQAERQARDAAEQHAKAEAEEKIRQAEQPAIAEAEAAELARKQQEEQARDEEERQELQAWLAAERLAAVEAEAHAKAEAEAEELARKQKEEAARAEAERRARDEAERRAKEEAEEQTRREAEQQAIAQAAAEAEALSRRTAEYQAEAENEKKAYAQAARLARAEQEKESQAEAVRLAQEELEARAIAEAEQQARLEAELSASAAAKVQAVAETEKSGKKPLEKESGAQAKRLAHERVEKSAAPDKDALARVTVQFDSQVEARALAEGAERAKREALQRERDDAMVKAIANVAERDRLEAEEPPPVSDKQQAKPAPAVVKKEQAKPEPAVVKKEQAKPAPVVVNKEQAEPAFRETAEQPTEEHEHDEAGEPTHEEAEEPAPFGAQSQGTGLPAKLIHFLESRWSVIKPSISWGRIAMFMFVTAVCMPLLLFQFASLDRLIPLIETIASARLGEPVSVGSLHGSLWPSPHLRLEGVRIGSTKDVKISAVRAAPALGTLFDENKSLKSLEVEGLAIEQSALPRMLDWLGSDARQQKLQLATVILKNTALGVKNISVPLFDATVQLNPAGKFESAVLRSTDGTMNVEISMHGGVVEVDFSARQWTPPLGPKITYDNLHAKAVVDANEMRIGEIVAGIFDGTARARATVSWAKGWRAEGELTLADVDLEKVSPKFTEAMPISGKLRAKAGFSMAGTGLDKLFDNTRVQGSFDVQSGALDKIDLARIIRSGDGNASIGGQTRFTELTGQMALSGNIYQYRQIKLMSGLLMANGSFDVSPSGALSGNIIAELGSATSSTRAALVLSGQAKNPQLGRSRAVRETVPVKPENEPS